jgi:hypothetical protein
MTDNHCTTDPDALLSLVESLKENYLQPPDQPPRRGKKRDFSALSFLLLAAVAVTLRTFRNSELHNLLEKDVALRCALGFSRVPHRTQIGRRLAGLIPEAEQQIALLGKRLVEQLKPPDDRSQLSAIDGRMYKASGPAWHKKDRLKQRIPVDLRNVDTESRWSKSGYRGWIQGYRLIVQCLVFPHPVPIFACWRANNLNEAQVALEALKAEVLPIEDVLLGDQTYSSPDFKAAYEQAGGWLLTPKQLPRKRRSWKSAVYEYRKESIELLFERIIQASDLKACQVKGEGRNGAFVLASVWLYQSCYLDDYRNGKPLAKVKEQVDCARWRIKS